VERIEFLRYSPSDEDVPVDCNLLDFAIVRYQNPCSDLVMFLYVSLDAEVRRQMGEETFLKTYHDALAVNLSKLGEDSNVYTYE